MSKKLRVENMSKTLQLEIERAVSDPLTRMALIRSINDEIQWRRRRALQECARQISITFDEPETIIGGMLGGLNEGSKGR
jgi:hypothetical protein